MRKILLVFYLFIISLNIMGQQFTSVEVGKKYPCTVSTYIYDKENHIIGETADSVLIVDNNLVNSYYLAVLINDSVCGLLNCGHIRTRDALNEFSNIIERKKGRNLDTLETIEKTFYRKNNLVKLYGEARANMILLKQVGIGWPVAMCKEAWGKPESVQSVADNTAAREKWLYKNNHILIFENGKLIEFK
jgi:hypothetical protein